jgi:hypothetical protein
MRDNVGIQYMQFSALVMFVFFSLYSNTQAFDFSGWDVLIKKHVEPKTIDGVLINSVDYINLKKDPLFSGLAAKLKSFPLENLGSDKSKLTYWINVYNILAAKIITDNYPLKSIKDAGSLFKSVWKKPAGILGGKQYSLNDIEHKILRNMNEPRIHVAIVCASVSCPDLRLEVYTVDKLDEQLDDQMRLFLRSREKGMRFDEQNKQVYLSLIFKWFAEDFENHGGVVQYIGKYITAEENSFLNYPKIKISYLDYNWKINDYKPKG